MRADSRTADVLRVDALRPDPVAIERAAAALRAGQLVVFPTETVYGLGANALDEAAVRKIYAAKARPATNPVIVHASSVEAARELAREWPAAAERLARAFWPGPLTLVVRKHERVPALVTAGLPAVGLRVPSHPVALALLRAARVPVAAPSANRSSELSPTAVAHLDRGLLAHAEVVLDAGACEVGIESAVVDVTRDPPRLLRPGALTLEELRAAAGALEASADVIAAQEPAPAPGMHARHYAPRAKLVLVDARDPGELARAAERAEQERARGGRVAALGFGGLAFDADETRQLDARDALGAARALYALLHELDAAGATLVLAELPPDGEAWRGVRDRLRRAAAEE